MYLPSKTSKWKKVNSGQKNAATKERLIFEMQQDTCTNVIPSLTATNSENESKEVTSKVPSNIFRGFEVRRKVRLMFWRPKDSMKGKRSVFCGYKQRNKVCLMYL